MSDATTFSTQFVTTCAEMLQHATRQRRTALRVLALTVAMVLVVGRTMVSRMLMVAGMSTRDWSATYRLFAHGRIAPEDLFRQVTARWLELYPPDAPAILVMDGTQLPRTGRHMPGAGYTIHPRTAIWNPGMHLVQRFEGVSGLTPLTTAGDSRAIPLWFHPMPGPKARPWPGHAPRKEWEAGIDGVRWVRETMDALTGSPRPLVVTADGSYAGAPVWNALPPNTTLIARCAKNRALYALPDPNEPCHRGRKRLYGPRGPSPHDQEQHQHRQRVCTVVIRGKTRHLKVSVSGPWVLQKAPDHPLMLLTIGGFYRQEGKSIHKRPMMHFLVNARQTDTGWVLPYPLEDLVTWVWQRWEVEVMHKELKSGWGLGDQQQWSPVGAFTVIQWVVWAYAVLMLTGAVSPPPPRRAVGWYHPRRWTPRDLTRVLREELWLQSFDEKTVVSAVFPTNPPQNTALRVLLEVADAI